MSIRLSFSLVFLYVCRHLVYLCILGVVLPSVSSSVRLTLPPSLSLSIN
jgi:hypothetical protein